MGISGVLRGKKWWNWEFAREFSMIYSLKCKIKSKEALWEGEKTWFDVVQEVLNKKTNKTKIILIFIRI